MLLNLNPFMPGDNKMQDIKATGLFKCFQIFLRPNPSQKEGT